MKWLFALLLGFSAACASAAQDVPPRDAHVNGHGNCVTPEAGYAGILPEGKSSHNETCHDRIPHPSPPPKGEVGKVSLREFHVKHFVRGSHQQIISAHAGKPFIVTFWSLTCTNCRDDLALFGKLVQKYRDLDLIIVSTDSPEQNREISRTLQRYHLGKTESWVFADSFAERLRFEVDAQWYGELPRTYFYDAQGHVLALSGTLDHVQTENWIHESRKHG